MVSDMTNPNVWFDKDVPEEIRFIVDCHYIPEGQEDMVKLMIFSNGKVNIIFFIWKTLQVQNNLLHIQHKRNTWSLCISKGNLLHFEYKPLKRILVCNEGILDKVVGWPIERISVEQMFKELEGRSSSRNAKVSNNSFKWLKRTTKDYLKEVEINIHETCKFGKSLLHVASKIPDPFFLQCLISKFEDVNLVDKSFMTPLHEACRAGCLENARLLLSYGASVNSITSTGNTPLMLLANRTNPDLKLAKLLVKYNASCDIENNDNMRAVDIARQICKTSPLIPIIHPFYSQVKAGFS